MLPHRHCDTASRAKFSYAEPDLGTSAATAQLVHSSTRFNNAEKPKHHQVPAVPSGTGKQVQNDIHWGSPAPVICSSVTLMSLITAELECSSQGKISSKVKVWPYSLPRN